MKANIPAGIQPTPHIMRHALSAAIWQPPTQSEVDAAAERDSLKPMVVIRDTSAATNCPAPLYRVSE